MTIPQYAAEVARVEEIIGNVIDDLRGNVDTVDTIEPRKRFCIGVLTPPHLDQDSIGASRRRRRAPESIGFSARASSEGGVISGSASVTLRLWYRITPTYEEQRDFVGIARQSSYLVKPVFSSHIVAIPQLPFSIMLREGTGRIVGDVGTANQAIVQAFEDAKSEILRGPFGARIFPGNTKLALKPEDLASPQAYRAAVSGEADLPTWHAALNVGAIESSDGWRLVITFSNSTGGPKLHQAELFDAQFGVELRLGRFVGREFFADRNETRFETAAWGRGINAVLEVAESNSRRAVAKTVPVYRQPRTRHRENNAFTDPEMLSCVRVNEATDALICHLQDYLTRWQQRAGAIVNKVKRNTAELDIQALNKEIDLVRLGIRALQADDRLMRAFQFMNEAVLLHANGDRKFTWRPFQIAFILAMLPSLLAREVRSEPWISELRQVDVLWFNTGGGKSEALFGLILVALFYDRLRGKSHGVTAWMRYPLRMLSIQQLQRLVEFIVAGEEIRTRHAIVGDSFSVGYYVGEQNTPNRLTDSRGMHPIDQYKRRAESAGESFLRVLQRCPFPKCHSLDVRVVVESDITKVRILHRCNTCRREAPIHISDSEIYRYLPGVLVGTVDRLARAGQTDEFGRIFGQVDSECPQHRYARHKQCIEAGCNLTKRSFTAVPPLADPTPALLIQDELHLLKESLGTYDAHYEGFLDSFAAEIGSGLLPKRVAATATIEGFERHVRELYGLDRGARRFPARGPGNLDSAYIEPYEDERVARYFVGVHPTGLTSDQVASRIALAVHRAAVQSETLDIASSIDAQYDVTLLYANTKDSLGNMGADLKPYLPNISSITGERSLAEVRDVIDTLAADESKPLKERTPAVVSTSIISHGVDVSRLNVMAFSGFPGKAADYIQSSSRVGRSHVGLVFMVCDPTREIDRSTFAHFYEYHERMYALVQPVPIIRFSQSALQRTFTGIFAATLINTLNAVKDGDYGQGRKAAASLVAGQPSQEELERTVSQAYGIEQLTPDLRVRYRDQIRRNAGIARDQVINNNDDWSCSGRLRPKPVASLREVQEQIGFDVTPRRHREVQILRRARR